MNLRIILLYIAVSYLRAAFASFGEDCLKRHNFYRALHEGTKPLKLNNKIQAYAQEWANHLARTFSTAHRPPPHKYGSNIFYCPNKTAHANAAVDRWYCEVINVDWSNIEFTTTTGHFTQVVWKESRQLGCAASIGVNGLYVVANYHTAGNILESFTENIGSVSSISKTCAKPNVYQTTLPNTSSNEASSNEASSSERNSNEKNPNEKDSNEKNPNGKDSNEKNPNEKDSNEQNPNQKNLNETNPDEQNSNEPRINEYRVNETSSNKDSSEVGFDERPYILRTFVWVVNNSKRKKISNNDERIRQWQKILAGKSLSTDTDDDLKIIAEILKKYSSSKGRIGGLIKSILRNGPNLAEIMEDILNIAAGGPLLNVKDPKLLQLKQLYISYSFTDDEKNEEMEKIILALINKFSNPYLLRMFAWAMDVSRFLLSSNYNHRIQLWKRILVGEKLSFEDDDDLRVISMMFGLKFEEEPKIRATLDKILKAGPILAELMESIFHIALGKSLPKDKNPKLLKLEKSYVTFGFGDVSKNNEMESLINDLISTIPKQENNYDIDESEPCLLRLFAFVKSRVEKQKWKYSSQNFKNRHEIWKRILKGDRFVPDDTDIDLKLISEIFQQKTKRSGPLADVIKKIIGKGPDLAVLMEDFLRITYEKGTCLERNSQLNGIRRRFMRSAFKNTKNNVIIEQSILNLIENPPNKENLLPCIKEAKAEAKAIKHFKEILKNTF